MTKLEIAQNVNGVKDLGRIIATNWDLEFVEGQIYDNRGKVESWTDRDNSTQCFQPETKGLNVYVLQCNQVPCHVVDYDNEDECYELGATDCESEAECLVLPTTKMIATYVSCPEEVEEMGYCLVELELVND